jgi:hypothetical protein
MAGGPIYFAKEKASPDPQEVNAIIRARRITERSKVFLGLPDSPSPHGLWTP